MSTSNEPKRMPQLSVAIIARGAALTIGQTLESVKAIADEMIVLDTGSTDETIEIAEQQGATVYCEAWQDDFAAARNQCLEKVTGNWVLWLDAEEYLDENDAQQLREFINQMADPSKAYMMIVQMANSDHQTTNTEQIGKIRLHPNMPNLNFVGRVREQLLPRTENADLEIEGIPWRIHRSLQTHNSESQIERADRNLKLAKMDISEKGNHSRLQNVIGVAQNTFGQYAAAAQTFQASIAIAEVGSAEMLEAYYGLLTASDYSESARENRLSICSKALESFPLDTQLLVAMGTYLQASDRLDLACRAFQLAYEHGQINPEVWHLTEIPLIAASCCSVALQLEEKDDQSQQVLETTLENYPQSFGLRRRLIELHIKHGRKKEALAQLDHLPAETPNLESLRIAVRGASLMAKQQWTSAISYLNTAYEAGCRDEICLRGLSVAYLSTAQVDQAESYVQQWLVISPDNEEAKAYREVIRQSRLETVATEEINTQAVVDQSTTIPPEQNQQPIRRIDQASADEGQIIHPAKVPDTQSISTSLGSIPQPPSTTSS